MRRADWCYISGAVAATETRLLGDAEFLELLRAESIATLVSRLRQSHTYRHLSGDADPERLSSAIESAVVEALRDLGRTSPDTGPVDLMLSPYDYQQVRNYVKAQVQEHPFEPTPFSELTEEELAAAWDDLFDASSRWAEACRLVRQELAVGGDSNLVIDLVIDRAELAGLTGYAASLGSGFIRDCTSEYTVDKARLALVRARLGGLESEQVRRLGSGLLSTGELSELTEQPVERLADRLRADRSRAGETSESLTRFAQEADNRRTDRLRDARGFAFGPERVFGYAWGLSMECLNLKLISETKLLGAPADMTEWRLRKSYA